MKDIIIIIIIDGGRLFHSFGAVTSSERPHRALSSVYATSKCPSHMAGTLGSCHSVNAVPVMAGMDVAVLLGRVVWGHWVTCKWAQRPCIPPCTQSATCSTAQGFESGWVWFAWISQQLTLDDSSCRSRVLHMLEPVNQIFRCQSVIHYSSPGDMLRWPVHLSGSGFEQYHIVFRNVLPHLIVPVYRWIW